MPDTPKTATPSESYLQTKKQSIKASFKKWGRRTKTTLKFFALCGVSSFALCQWVPDDATTQSLDAYMAEHDQAGISKHFNTASIRVYSRANPLYVFRAAGDASLISADMKNNEHPGMAAKTLSYAVNYPSMLLGAASHYIFSNPVDAYSMADKKPFDQRRCFIRPPASDAFTEMANAFTSLEAETYTFESHPNKLKRLFLKYIMLHEARHCDQRQDSAIGLNAIESDSDLYAFRVLEATEKDQIAVAELKEFVKKQRIFHGVINGDTDHLSTAAMDRGSQTPLQAILNTSNATLLRDIIITAIDINEDKFDDKMRRNQQYYETARQLLDSKILQTVPDVEKTARDFVASVEFFDKITHGTVLGRKMKTPTLNLSAFKKDFIPVPDKIPPAKKVLKASA